VILRDDAAARTFGPPQRTVREAIQLALGRVSSRDIPTSFTDADLRPFRAYATDPAWAGGTRLFDTRRRHTTASPAAVFAAVSRLGGEKGWYGGTWLWRVRGLLDQLWGGPGLRRGRRDPHTVRVGDFVDFWRVEEVSAPFSLRLHAEMLLPGDAWLEWHITPAADGCELRQTATFQPRGLLGRLYWYSVAPFHFLVFPGLLRGILRDARS
jgi:hypothetical protein